jgi:hypothetical protein
MTTSRAYDDLDGMPDLNLTVRRQQGDTRLGRSRHSSQESDPNPLNSEEISNAIERTQIERDTLAVVLEEQCEKLTNRVLTRGRRSIVNHITVGLARRMEQLRQAHLDHNIALQANNETLCNTYTYIIGFELHVRDCSKIADDYLHFRRNSPASSVSGQSMQPDRDSPHFIPRTEILHVVNQFNQPQEMVS